MSIEGAIVLTICTLVSVAVLVTGAVIFAVLRDRRLRKDE